MQKPNIYHLTIPLEEDRDYDVCNDIIHNSVVCNEFKTKPYTHLEWEGQIYEAGLTAYGEVWMGELIN